jgi:hypothetical protein
LIVPGAARRGPAMTSSLLNWPHLAEGAVFFDLLVRKPVKNPVDALVKAP